MPGPMATPPPGALPSIREATLTVSPMTVWVRPPSVPSRLTEATPLLMPTRNRGQFGCAAWTAAAASCSASPAAAARARVVRLVAALVEGDHQRVADDPVDVAAVPSYHRRYDDLEVGVQHRRDLGRIVVLGERGEPLQIGEQHAQLAPPGHRVLEVEVGEPLLVPLDPYADDDEDEGGEHQHVPFPPRQRPVPGEHQRHHRLGQQDERRDHRQQHQRRPFPPQSAGSAPPRRRTARSAGTASAVRMPSALSGTAVSCSGGSRSTEATAHNAISTSSPARSHRPHRTAATARAPDRFRLDSTANTDAERDPDRRRQDEARVRCVEQHLRRRQRMQRRETRPPTGTPATPTAPADPHAAAPPHPW